MVVGYFAAALSSPVYTGANILVCITGLDVRTSHVADAGNALREVPVAQPTLTALLSVRLFQAQAAACVGVTLLGH